MEENRLIRVQLEPGGPFTYLDVGGELSRIRGAEQAGKRFLLVDDADVLAATRWIVASFFSSLVVVPLSSKLSWSAKNQLLQNLPSGSWVAGEQLLEKYPIGPIYEKSLQDIWAVIFSSGSTGIPKGVALAGRALKSAAEAHSLHLGAFSWLLNLPLHHVGGLSVITRAYFLNRPISIEREKFSLESMQKWLDANEVEGISLVPTMLHRILRAGLRPPSALRAVLLGGAGVSRELFEEGLASGFPLLRTYGLTENCSQAATERRVNGGLELLPNVELEVDEGGVISIRSPSLASGYYRSGSLQGLDLKHGFFCTGDLGKILHGKPEIHGRSSEVIHSGGEKIFPSDIEPVLSTIPGILDCAVLSLPSEEWGEMVCAAVVSDAPNFLAFGNEVKKSLGSIYVPKKWVKVSQIPRSATGKILRAEVRALVEKELSS